METHNAIFNRVKNMTLDLLKASQGKNFLSLPEITLETDLVDDLGIDSIEMLDLATAISEEFKVNIINTPQLAGIKKISDIVRCIEKLQSHQ